MHSTDTIIDHRRRIRRVTNYVNQHLEATFNLDHIAKIACYSEYHFIRVFEMLMGETPCKYIIWKKMEKAGFLLLQGNLSITDVAFFIAYGTPSSFCKTFKTHFGISPRQFRDSVPLDQYLKANHPFRALNGNRNHSTSMPKPIIKELPAMNLLCIENMGVSAGNFLASALQSFGCFKEKIRQYGLQDITRNSVSIYPFRPVNSED